MFFLGVRTALLESEDNECPDCNEKGSSPGSLIPNRFLRNSVNLFKNETGYNKPRPQQPLRQKPKEVDIKEEESAPSVKPEEVEQVVAAKEEIEDVPEAVIEELKEMKDEQKDDSGSEEIEANQLVATASEITVEKGNLFDYCLLFIIDPIYVEWTDYLYRFSISGLFALY